MSEDFELNRLEFVILDTLHDAGCTDHFHSMTITELIAINDNGIGTRLTIYRKMQKLLKAGYIEKGVVDNHADTFYLKEKSLKLFKGGNE